MFPNTVIKHDYHLAHGLKVDFVVFCGFKLGVEIDGEQHYCFNSRWHKDTSDFLAQCRRDREKEELCVKEGIVLARVDCRKGVVPAQVKSTIRDTLKATASFTPTPKEKKEPSEFQLKMKERQRKARKEAYTRWKERQKENKRKDNL